MGIFGGIAGSCFILQGIRHSRPLPMSPIKVLLMFPVYTDENLQSIPADIPVGLGSDTLLSEKFIALSGGNPNGQFWNVPPSFPANPA